MRLRVAAASAVSVKIIVDQNLGPQVSQLLEVHLSELALESPAESMHALAIDELRDELITVWSAWDGDEMTGRLMGIGALKELSATHGEIKSMRAAAEFQRCGVATGLLEQIMTTARQRKYKQLSLETGVVPSFKPAHTLYTRFGFKHCAPFADYKEDPHSLFMTCRLCDSIA